MFDLSDLENFIELYHNFIDSYKANCIVVDTMEEHTQDLLHELELSEEKDDAEMRKFFDEFKKVRQLRRQAKDENVLLSPFYHFHLSNDGVMRQFDAIKGEIRKADASLKNRTYTPRQRNDLTIPLTEENEKIEENKEPSEETGMSKSKIERELKKLRLKR